METLLIETIGLRPSIGTQNLYEWQHNHQQLHLKVNFYVVQLAQQTIGGLLGTIPTSGACLFGTVLFSSISSAIPNTKQHHHLLGGFFCGSTQPAQQTIDGLLNYIDINNIRNNNNYRNNLNYRNNRFFNFTNSILIMFIPESSSNGSNSSNGSSSSSESTNLNKKSIGGNLLSLSIGTSGCIGSTTINTTQQTKSNSDVTSVRITANSTRFTLYLYNCVGISRENILGGRDYIGSNSTNSSSSPSFKFNWAFSI
ncbi:hypothetical protein ACTFIZ_012701 [Dictyostelium cf. discoideum]